MKIKYPLLLDGGLSNELERQGCDLNHKLWSAQFLDANPEAIIEAHLSYLKSGAQCITTSSYQASVVGFMDMGYDRANAEALILKSVALAKEALERYNALGNSRAELLIAASIGPYGAYLSDGSEYRGNYGVSDETLRGFHIPQFELLDSSKAHFFACETIPSFQESKVLAEILRETKKPAWISFSCKDTQCINDGTPIEECAMYLADHPNIFAIGVNCTPPTYISGLIKNLKKKSGSKKIVIYPNSGEVFNAESKTWLGMADPKSYSTMVKEWLALGADIIGGCCRIGPEHIKGICEDLKSR